MGGFNLFSLELKRFLFDIKKKVAECKNTGISVSLSEKTVTKDRVCIVFLILSVQKRKTASYAVKEDSSSTACLQCVFLICGAREQPGFILDEYQFRMCCKTKKWSSLNSLFLLLI